MGEKLALYCLGVDKDHLELAMGELNCGLALTEAEKRECSMIAVHKQLFGELGDAGIGEIAEVLEAF